VELTSVQKLGIREPIPEPLPAKFPYMRQRTDDFGSRLIRTGSSMHVVAADIIWAIDTYGLTAEEVKWVLIEQMRFEEWSRRRGNAETFKQYMGR
jgi:hypothetical protein